MEGESSDVDGALWSTLLDPLCFALGKDPTSAGASVTAAHLGSADVEGWTERVALACEDLGAAFFVGTAALPDVVRAAGPQHPVVVADEDGGWILITDRRGRKVEIESARSASREWVHLRELAERMPVDQTETTFVAIEPAGLGTSAGSEDVPAPRSPWNRLRALIRAERHDVIVVLIYAIAVGLLSLATPVAVQLLVNTVAFGTLLQPLLMLTLLLLIGLGMSGVFRALQAWVVEILQQRLFLRLVNDLSYRLPRVQRAAFDRASGPELVNRFFDLFTIQKAVSSLLVGGLELVLAAVVGMLVLAFYHPYLLALDVLLILCVLGILFGLGRGATHTAVAESKAKYEVAAWLEEIARHSTAFKLAGGPALARARADELATRYLTYRKKHYRTVFSQLVGALTLQAIASAAILGIGGWLVIDRQLTLGQLVAAELVVTLVVASFAKVGKHLETTYDLLAALDKVGQLLDLPIEPPRAGRAIETSRAALSMHGLGLRFDDGARLLANVSCEIEPGARVALLGESGSGRSALVDATLGLRPVSGGSIRIDGVDLEDLDRRDLRERTALVRADEIIAGTILDNVVFGRPSIDAQGARAALDAVGILDAVLALPAGLSTRLMPEGAPLSKGQAARLVLARAIAGKPSLLVIDGALDGLDPTTREAVLERLVGRDAPWTLLLVTNDPDTAARCHRTLRITDEGNLVEESR
ncbi:MAG: peptidase domain-containing ABC transporter [Sandaracinaceae bacterium]